MGLPRVRFTVRRMMVAVAAVALMSYGVVLWRRASEYRGRADSYGIRVIMVDSGLSPDDLERKNRRLNEYYESMQRKYDRAARYPWLPVAPDPPEPE